MNAMVRCSIVVACVALQVGCGTLMGGTKHKIQVRSTPEATVSINRIGFSETTPATLRISRKQECVLTFTKEGYDTKKVALKRGMRVSPLLGEGLLISIGSSLAAIPGSASIAGYITAGVGLGGLIVDIVSGGLFGFEESYIEVALTKASAEAEGPEVIRVGLLFETGSRGQGLVRTTAPVPVHIIVEAVE